MKLRTDMRGRGASISPAAISSVGIGSSRCIGSLGTYQRTGKARVCLGSRPTTPTTRGTGRRLSLRQGERQTFGATLSCFQPRSTHDPGASGINVPFFWVIAFLF